MLELNPSPGLIFCLGLILGPGPGLSLSIGLNLYLGLDLNLNMSLLFGLGFGFGFVLVFGLNYLDELTLILPFFYSIRKNRIKVIFYFPYPFFSLDFSHLLPYNQQHEDDTKSKRESNIQVLVQESFYVWVLVPVLVLVLFSVSV